MDRLLNECLDCNMRFEKTEELNTHKAKFCLNSKYGGDLKELYNQQLKERGKKTKEQEIRIEKSEREKRDEEELEAMQRQGAEQRQRRVEEEGELMERIRKEEQQKARQVREAAEKQILREQLRTLEEDTLAHNKQQKQHNLQQIYQQKQQLARQEEQLNEEVNRLEQLDKLEQKVRKEQEEKVKGILQNKQQGIKDNQEVRQQLVEDKAQAIARLTLQRQQLEAQHQQLQHKQYNQQNQQLQHKQYNQQNINTKLLVNNAKIMLGDIKGLANYNVDEVKRKLEQDQYKLQQLKENQKEDKKGIVKDTTDYNELQVERKKAQENVEYMLQNQLDNQQQQQQYQSQQQQQQQQQQYKQIRKALDNMQPQQEYYNSNLKQQPNPFILHNHNPINQSNNNINNNNQYENNNKNNYENYMTNPTQNNNSSLYGRINHNNLDHQEYYQQKSPQNNFQSNLQRKIDFQNNQSLVNPQQLDNSVQWGRRLNTEPDQQPFINNNNQNYSNRNIQNQSNNKYHKLNKNNQNSSQSLTNQNEYFLQNIVRNNQLSSEEVALLNLQSQEVDDLHILEKLSAGTELYRFKVEQYKEMSTNRAEMAKLLQEQRLQQLRRHFERDRREDDRLFQNSKWIDEQRKLLIQQKMNIGPLESEIAMGELVVHLDYVRGLPPSTQYFQLVLAIYQQQQQVYQPILVEPKECEVCSPVDNQCLLGEAHLIQDLLCSQDTLLIMELQLPPSLHIAYNHHKTTTIGWTCIDLYDYRAQLKRGKYRLPVIQPPTDPLVRPEDVRYLQ